MDPRWGVDDWLYSVRARIASVKESAEFTSQLVESYCAALWPDEPLPETSEVMLQKLDRVQERMIEWRESAARVGADEALCWILSIYETIDLDKIPGVRVASKWIKDPELVEKRERKAQTIIETSDLHEFRLHPNAPPEEKEAARKMAMERRCKREQDCSALPFNKGRTPVYLLFPGSLIAYT